MNGPMRRARRFALWGAALAWLVHLLGCYAIAEFGCLSGLHRVRYGGVTLVAWMLIGLTLAALSAAIAGCLTAGRTLRDPALADTGMERYLTRVGLWMSGFFTLIIVAQSLPIRYYMYDC